MKALNVSKNKMLGTKIKIAGNFWKRFQGLIGSAALKEGEGLLIPFCQGVHTFGMKYAIDVIYLGTDGEVVSMVEGMRPQMFGPINFLSKNVLELPVGTIRQSCTELADVVSLEESKDRNFKSVSFLDRF